VSVIEHFWHRVRAAHLVLYPLSLLFGVAVGVRRALYAHGILRAQRLPVPVIVVGNLTVGGSGKTPLTLWLAQRLRESDRRPGIITRGYRGSERLQEVRADSDPAQAGDEALLLARRSRCPVFTGRDRVAAARALLRAHPECDLLLSDDGLQHYRLARDIELAVIDGTRRLGNGWLLPAGPLREPPTRLRSVDAIVINGGVVNAGNELEALPAPVYAMRLEGDLLVNLKQPARALPLSDFAGRDVHALAGIGHPQRFFAQLEQAGLSVRPQPFPDHFAFAAEDLAFAGDQPLLMTEKDAVKCAAFARESWWYLPVTAQVDPALAALLLGQLKRLHGPPYGSQAA